MISCRNWKAAFHSTIPVLMGYLTMGMAAGILLTAKGGIHHSPFWGAVTSTACVSGALQFLMVEWIRVRTSLMDVAILTLCLNLRYAMYGISLLERFRGIPLLRKLFLIWGLTDETYALQVENRTPLGENSLDYCTAVCLLDACYWIGGVCLGTITGAFLPFSTKGIDFTMTALFLVILVDQCRSSKVNCISGIIGGFCALLSRLLFPQGKMLVPAMALMFVIFLGGHRLFCRYLGAEVKNHE